MQGKESQQALITVHYRSRAGEHMQVIGSALTAAEPPGIAVSLQLHRQTTAAALPGLVAAGEVDGKTLVWVEGLSNWAPLEQAAGEAVVLGQATVARNPLWTYTVLCAPFGRTLTVGGLLLAGTCWGRWGLPGRRRRTRSRHCSRRSMRTAMGRLTCRSLPRPAG